MSEKIFRTSDHGLAGYLVYLGFNCIGAVPTKDDKRLDFVFIDIDDAEKHTNDFLTHNDQVSASKYKKKLDQVRWKLRDTEGISEIKKLLGE